MARKIYDTWMNASRASERMIAEGTSVINDLMANVACGNLRYGEDFLLKKFEFVGCAARVQIEADEDAIEEIRIDTKRDWQETKPLP